MNGTESKIIGCFKNLIQYFPNTYQDYFMILTDRTKNTENSIVSECRRARAGANAFAGIAIFLGMMVTLLTPFDRSHASQISQANPVVSAKDQPAPPVQAATTSAVSGYTLPADLAKEFPKAQSYCTMGPEKLIVSKTSWIAYACSDYRSIVLVGNWPNGDTYVFTVTTYNSRVVVRGSGTGPADAIAATGKSLMSLSIGGLVDMNADVVVAWRLHSPSGQPGTI
jgi:hypothetical protein